MNRTEQSGNWPGYSIPSPNPKPRKDGSRPVRPNAPPVATGIALTDEERNAAALGFAGKSEWVRAGECFIPFGKHKGRTIHAVAQRSDGLGYLNWLHQQQQKRPAVNPSRFDKALAAYMQDQRVKDALLALGA